MRLNRPYKIQETSDCLCGSGTIFVDCCKPNLPSRSNIIDRTGKLMSASNFGDALVSCRADLTQYTIWHKSHTVPGITKNKKVFSRLFKIDYEALCEIVERLLVCYQKTNNAAEFSEVLKRLRVNVNHKKWRTKLQFFNIISVLGEGWDHAATVPLLRDMGPIGKIKDIEILELYTDILCDETSFSDLLLAYESIIKSPKLRSKIHYGLSKAILLLSHGDNKGCVDALKSAASLYESQPSDFSPDAHLLDRYAGINYYLGVLTIDEKRTAAARKIFTTLIDKTEYRWTQLGRSNLYLKRADCEKSLDNWEPAFDDYSRAYDMRPAPVLEVFKAECLLRLNRLEEAGYILEGLSQSSFSNIEERVDYVLGYGEYSLALEDHSIYLKSKTLLNGINPRTPMCRQKIQRMQILIERAIIAGTTKEDRDEAREVVTANGWRSLFKYVNFEPSMFGLSIDIDQFFRDRHKKRK